MSRPYFQSRKQKFANKKGSEFGDPPKYFEQKRVGPGESVNWPVWWNGAHTHYMQTQGRVANALKGVEVLPRAEHPGELPEEPDTNGMTTKDRETAVAEYKMAADRYWRMNSIYAPQKEKLDDGKVQIAQDLLSVRVKFDLGGNEKLLN